ncbi:MAG: methionyl-tRNA formyltransferase [Nanoarchaeota archaeon]
MNIVFTGSTELGMLCCQKLIDLGEHVAGIISAPENIKITSTPHTSKNVLHRNFSSIAKRHEIPYYEIGDRGMKDEGLVGFLQKTEMDFMLVAGWHHIIPEKIRRMAPKGAAGIHASLLPKYRGGAPLVWAIINGETETGVSLFYLEKGIDTGGILAQSRIPIAFEDDIRTLYDKVNIKSVEIVIETIPKVRSGTLDVRTQDELQATYFPLRFPSDGIIDWDKNAIEIYNWVRAQTKPYPGAYTYLDGNQKTLLWKVSPAENLPENSHLQPGEIMHDGANAIVHCREGYVRLLDYEISGENNPVIRRGRFGNYNE